MTVEPEWLGAAIALVLGRSPETTLVTELARVLDQREEVLPWLMLRQSAFADDPEVIGKLNALAAAGNRPSQHRPSAPLVAPEAFAMQHDIEQALHQLIAQNIAGSRPARTIGATLHRRSRTLPGRLDDFHRRIVETAPEPEDPVEP